MTTLRQFIERVRDLHANGQVDLDLPLTVRITNTGLFDVDSVRQRRGPNRGEMRLVLARLAEEPHEPYTAAALRRRSAQEEELALLRRAPDALIPIPPRLSVDGLRYHDSDGRQIVTVNDRWAYRWDGNSARDDGLLVGDRVLPPRWRERDHQTLRPDEIDALPMVTSQGSDYRGQLRTITRAWRRLGNRWAALNDLPPFEDAVAREGGSYSRTGRVSVNNLQQEIIERRSRLELQREITSQVEAEVARQRAAEPPHTLAYWRDLSERLETDRQRAADENRENREGPS